jgi:hypothetical protein
MFFSFEKPCKFKMQPCVAFFLSVQFHVNLKKRPFIFCSYWFLRASGIWFKGDIVMDFKPEITRASKLRCARCGLKGAALGCYYGPCLTSFHVPCAVQTIGCRWDGVSSITDCY